MIPNLPTPSLLQKKRRIKHRHSIRKDIEIYLSSLPSGFSSIRIKRWIKRRYNRSLIVGFASRDSDGIVRDEDGGDVGEC